MTARLEHLLRDAARNAPDAPAVGDATGQRLGYAELAERVQTAARALSAAGIGPGDRIGVSLPKTVEALVAVYAILTAGAAYVPVDVSAPLPRSAGIFADCGVRAVICADKDAPQLTQALAAAGHEAGKQIPLPGVGQVLVADRPGAPAQPDLAYILYTSGSTGKPKGVAHTHGSALAFVDWCSETFRPRQADRFSSHAPFHFDLSILDIYLPAMHAAYLRLVSADEGKSPRHLAALIQDEGLTFWYSTPSILKALVEFGNIAEHDHSALRVVCFAGEVFAPKQLRALAAHWPGPRFFNLYGPTETNVCTAYEVTDAATWPVDQPIPIGHAACGDDLLLVDQDGNPAPPGQPGELVVHGPSVMREYWNAPDRTAEAFAQIGGRHWYRTGDIVQPGEDGALIYRGRRDRMVKRRGYRIELGEIEAAMLRHEAISECAAVAVEKADGDVAIVVFHNWNSDAAPSLIALKRHGNQNLPGYMIPDAFQKVDALPMTSTDKIDYQTLKGRAVGLFADR